MHLRVTGLILAFTFALAVPAHGQQPPLTLSQIEQLISVGTPDEAVAEEIHQRGISFSPTSSATESLRQKGGGPRTLMSLGRAAKPRSVCFLTGHGEHELEDSSDKGYSEVKALLDRRNYNSKPLPFKPTAQEPEGKIEAGQPEPNSGFNVQVPSDCVVLVVGGPQVSYSQPLVIALQNYVEGGGGAMFLLDETLRIGRSEPPADNGGLAKVLSDWGVTVNKDLVLDLSGQSQVFGLGSEVPVVLEYESPPITQLAWHTPTAYPLARSLETRTSVKTMVYKLVTTTDNAIATSEIGPDGTVDLKKGKKGPFTLIVAGSYAGTKQGRFVVAGTSLWIGNNREFSVGLHSRPQVSWLENSRLWKPAII
jgi:hypothetical protein